MRSPTLPNQLPNAPAKMLFEGSSILTPFMRSAANAQHGLNLTEGARGFVLGKMVVTIEPLTWAHADDVAKLQLIECEFLQLCHFAESR